MEYIALAVAFIYVIGGLQYIILGHSTKITCFPSLARMHSWKSLQNINIIITVYGPRDA